MTRRLRKRFRKESDGEDISLMAGFAGIVAAASIFFGSSDIANDKKITPKEKLNPDIKKEQVLKEPFQKPSFPAPSSQKPAKEKSVLERILE